MVTAFSRDGAPRPRWWLQAGRYLLAALPLFWLARTVDFREVGRVIAGSDGLLLLAAAGGFFGSQMVGAARWSVLMRAFGVAAPPRWLTLWRHIMVGLYFNALPSGLAGDVVRGLRVRQVCGGLAPAYAVLLTERVCGLVGLLLIAAMSLLWRRTADGTLLVVQTMGVGAFLAVALTFAIFFGPRLLGRLPGRQSRIGLIRRVHQIIDRFPGPPSLGGLTVAVLMSLFTQGFAVLALTLVVHSVAPSAPLLAVLRSIPPILLLCFIHITPAAIGQRESLYVLFLQSAEVSPERALAASVLHFGILMFIVAAGGLVYLLEPRVEHQPEQEARRGAGS